MEKHQRQELQVILDAMPMMFFHKDTENRILRVNKAVADAVGASVESMVGTASSQWFPDEAGDYYRDDLEVMRSGQPRLGIIEQLQVENANKQWICTDKYPHYNAAGKVDGILVYIRDATNESQATKSLRESEERLRTIIQSEPECVKTLAPDGSITQMNPAGLQILAADRAEDVLGSSIYDWLVPEHHEAFRELHRRVQAGGSESMEYQIVDLKGDHHWIESHVVRLAGADESLLAISRNITERREAERQRLELEQQVRQAQKLESIGVLAAGVAHDFNNHLMAIMGNIDMASALAGDNAQLRGHLEASVQAARQAAEMCSKLLTYAGKKTLELQPTNLSQLIRDFGDLLKLSISKKAELRIELGESLPVVNVDRAQINQILVNLVTNASDALGDDSGEIVISSGVRNYAERDIAGMIDGTHIDPGRYVYLRVTDSGSGMTAIVREQIFQPFFTTKTTGRGLGLATVLGTIRGHGGTITVDSAPGRGTTFELLLPESDAVTTGSGTPHELVSGHVAAGTILLADDERSVRTLLQAILEKAGYKVVTAYDGCRAVDIFAQHRQDIVAAVLDITMPGLDGIEVYTKINRLKPGIPVLFSSGYPAKVAIDKFRALPQVDFLQKPYASADLILKLAQLLDTRSISAAI